MSDQIFDPIRKFSFRQMGFVSAQVSYAKLHRRKGRVYLSGNFSGGGGCVVSTSPVSGCLNYLAALLLVGKLRGVQTIQFI